jgi:hypothetical protein
MGNWRSVDIVGTIDPEDVRAAKRFVNTGDDYDRFHALCNYGPSLCGLGDWANETVMATGNLSERDYEIEDVAETLREMAKQVPSLAVKVYCGGEWESTKCVATVNVAHGKVWISDPEVDEVGQMIGAKGAMNLALIMRSQY